MMKFLKTVVRKALPWYDESVKLLKLHAKAHKNYVGGRKHRADYYAYRISKCYRCYVHPNAEIGEHCFLPHPVGIVIGEGVKVGNGTAIYQGVTLGRRHMDKADYPIVGSGVIIYAHAVVAGGVKIGDGAVVGCNSVVLRDVAEGEVVSGVVK